MEGYGSPTVPYTEFTCDLRKAVVTRLLLLEHVGGYGIPPVSYTNRGLTAILGRLTPNLHVNSVGLS